ncbi:UNKNOWN [Stylonychia lemnae]|uniref:Uncharacterized protein n=1 Tax=Stylonychia lemnae TaxID=5949 RepID=A0A078AFK0_STYLE|nr:UNKNOWN [Stylonychia lemnae]|eukprot:CDW80985.1 UNKNOWN [Stylonychia lemnae]
MTRQSKEEVMKLHIYCSHDIHINLNDEWNEVEVVANIMIYCRIKITEKFAPLMIKFQYFKDGRPYNASDMVLFLSTQNKQPNTDNHQIRLIRPEHLIHGERIFNKKFETQYLYLGLFSEEGCTLKVHLHFNVEMEKRFLKKQQEKEAEIDNDSSDGNKMSQSRKLAKRRQFIQNEIAEASTNPFYKKLIFKNYRELQVKRAKPNNVAVQNSIYSDQEKTISELGQFSLSQLKSQISQFSAAKELNDRKINDRIKDKNQRILETQERREAFNLSKLKNKIQNIQRKQIDVIPLVSKNQ